MVTPVTDYGTTTTTTSTYYRLQHKRSQAYPIDRPLPYNSDVGQLVSRESVAAANSTPGNAVTFWNPLTGSDMSGALMSCYSRFNDQLGQAAMGVTLAELPQSIRMITTRFNQLTELALALRRLNFQRAAQLVGRIFPRGKGIPGSFADLWLEWSFGWKPLAADIFSAVQVLQSPIPAPQVHASASGRYTSPYNDTGTYGGSIYTRNYSSWNLKCKMGAYVAVDNPNLWLANALGLTNPAVVAWELIPFSFVVDWFVNVEQFLHSGSDFYGLAMQNAYTSKSARGVAVFESYNVFQTPAHKLDSYFVSRMDRSLGITSPGLHIRPFKVWGWQRCLNAASLFIQQMRR